MSDIIQQNAMAGEFLKSYERERYTRGERGWRLLDNLLSIIVPADAEQFADVSFYQAGMDWDVYALNARAAIIRIGQNTWPDTSFASFYNEARARGIALGGYWFFDGRASPDQQLAVIKQQMAGRLFELELYIDWEKNYSGPYEGLPNVVKLMQLVEAAGIKCRAVGIYTGYYWFAGNSNATVNAAQYTYLKQRPLWLAWYASPSTVKVPQPWEDYTLWQYGTPVVNWGQPTAEIDMNKSRYSESTFKNQYLGGEPPEGETMQYIEGTALGSVKIRQAANGDEYIPPRYLVNGDKIKASEVFDNRWLHLFEINGAPAEGWASAGATQGYISWKWVTVPDEPPPPAPDPGVTITGVRYSGEVVFDYSDGTQEVWHISDAPLTKGPA